jgi:hypothetical protein
MRKSAPVSPTRIHRYSRAGLLALVLAEAAIGFGQVIENPAKPSAKDAGRVLQLTEVWRISDESGEFYFKYPRELKIADDGTIFLADAEQFLKFSADGKFLGNLYRKGQGPGEIGREFYYHLRGRDLFVQDMNSGRFWRADLDGRFQETVNLAGKDYRGFVEALPDGFLFLKTVWPPPNERTGKLMEILETVALVGPDGSECRDVAVFRPKTFLGPNTGMSWDPDILELSPDRALLYAVHSRDYVVEVIDLASGALVRMIKRIYPKVEHAEADWEPGFRKRTGAPKIEFESDVKELFPIKDGLWVATSTDDKAKGRLIDVFDKDGRFVDSFYLGAGRGLMAVGEGFLFCQEKKEDETITIAKYRIVN